MGVGGADRYDHLNDNGVQGTVTVGTSAVAIRVGGSNLADRKLVYVEADDNTIYIGYTSGVTTANGFTLAKRQYAWIPVGDEITLYAIADGAGRTLRVAEIA